MTDDFSETQRDNEINELESRLKDLRRENSRDRNSYVIPISIIIAGLLVAVSVIYSGGSGNQGVAKVVQDQQQEGTREQQRSVDKIKPVSGEDHILGSPDARVKIVEFSDTECPFCKKYHFTMKQIVEDFGSSGEVAWVYRHFPLDQLHRKARNEAEASECIASIGGNDAFWVFMDRLFEITPSNDGLDENELPKIAAYAGVDIEEFNNCLSSGVFAERVNEDYQDAVTSGGTGTPFSVIIGSDGSKAVISGAQPYDVVKRAVESALKNN